MTSVANRSKSDMDPAKYLAGVNSNQPGALAAQCIPKDQELWSLENYEAFLAARRKLLASELNGFLKSLAVTEDTIAPASLEDLISEGETEDLEFKSTLRWDLKQGVVNKRLEDVIIKSIAAFANGQGGTLLIGVADDGAIVGLTHDYASLGNVDRDKFELHLRNLLCQAMGEAFVASKIRISFPFVGDAEICQCEIGVALAPMIVKFADKNGVTAERFYVRSGNSSREMPMSEMQTYIGERFG